MHLAASSFIPHSPCLCSSTANLPITQICQKIGLEWFLSPPSSALTPHLTGLRFNVISSRHFSFLAQTWSSGTYFSPCYCKLLLFPEVSSIYCLFNVYLAGQTRSSKKPMFLFYPLTHCCIPQGPSQSWGYSKYLWNKWIRIWKQNLDTVTSYCNRYLG